MASTSHSSSANPRYFVPAPSAWPFVLTAGLVAIIIGVWGMLEDKPVGHLPTYFGIALSIFIIFRWFRGIAMESESGQYSKQVDMTYRMGMAWFIFSEVMFFAAFFEIGRAHV
jgi:cytochrome c oxidase subunit 3